MSRFAVPIAWVTLGRLWGSSFLWIKIAVDELPAGIGIVSLRYDAAVRRAARGRNA